MWVGSREGVGSVWAAMLATVVGNTHVKLRGKKTSTTYFPGNKARRAQRGMLVRRRKRRRRTRRGKEEQINNLNNSFNHHNQ